MLDFSLNATHKKLLFSVSLNMSSDFNTLNKLLNYMCLFFSFVRNTTAYVNFVYHSTWLDSSEPTKIKSACVCIVHTEQYKILAYTYSLAVCRFWPIQLKCRISVSFFPPIIPSEKCSLHKVIDFKAFFFLVIYIECT